MVRSLDDKLEEQHFRETDDDFMILVKFRLILFEVPLRFPIRQLYTWDKIPEEI